MFFEPKRIPNHGGILGLGNALTQPGFQFSLDLPPVGFLLKLLLQP